MVYLQIGMRVRLTVNLWIAAGLYNSAAGTVVDIIYEDGVHPPDLPLVVIV
jgi:hypothetical protein